ncbi:MAG: CDP-paratose 2-epimerase [Thermoleophilaceae bacterium]|nr:CDP-paratose 2-epimerase [Thermoleophilaceae bacterium]
MTASVPTSDRRILITGGAGFVGANLCLELAARHPEWRIVAFDNLKRRGSEINLPRLKEAGVEFAHGDVRELSDLLALDPVDAIVECSAEPSALAGVDGGTEYVVHTNLSGAYHCLELARRDRAQMIFLSTSRVYPVAAQERIAWTEADTRFEIAAEQEIPGVSPAGISERFPLEGARTLYGMTKLSGELLIAEYAETFGIPATINRCGVIAGPWQMGKVDQGVFTHWVLSHYTGKNLRYIGYGGKGKQVRDLLHIDDLVDLIEDQLLRPEHWSGSTANVGGGRDCSLSLVETTEICRELTGNTVQVEATDETRPGDVRVYLSDCGRLFEHTDWRPQRSPRDVLVDIFEWIRQNERSVLAALG